jgi:hypothetical protein
MRFRRRFTREIKGNFWSWCIAWRRRCLFFKDIIIILVRKKDFILKVKVNKRVKEIPVTFHRANNMQSKVVEG